MRDVSYYTNLAKSSPQALALVIESGDLDGVEWGIACEIAGKILPTSQIQGPLVRQLQKATNAEAFDMIMSGLNYHMDAIVMAIMQRLADKSDNPAIHSCAIDLIEQGRAPEEVSAEDDPDEDES